MFVLAALPFLVVLGLIVLGRSSVLAAAAGLLVAVLASALAFRTPASELGTAAASYAPLVLEVLLILLLGLVLARLLEASGAMRTMSTWLLHSSPGLTAGTSLVVFGVVPFAESVTGFGIGVTVGVPILRHMGHDTKRAALLGLLGLVAVPWGALGPGTTVAAGLTGLDLDALGVATAQVNLVPVLLAMVAVALCCRSELSRTNTWPILAGGALLYGGILAANLFVGTPPAGVLGSLLVLAVLLPLFRLQVGARPRTPGLFRALLPYLVLTLGLLSTILIAEAAAGSIEDSPWSAMLGILETPPVWLAVACAVAVGLDRGDAAPVVRTAARSWVPIGAATGMFMIMGWVMATTGMSATIGAGLAVLGAAPAPVLLALGGMLTGSNTGANAMFAPTVAAMSSSTGTSTLLLVALSNASGSFSAIATPPRVAMAVGLAGDEDDEPSARRWVQRRAVGLVLVSTCVYAAWAALV